MAAAPAVLEVATLVAARAEAEHQRRLWTGIPSRTAHKQTDRWLAVVQDADDALVPDTVLKWG